MNISEESKVHKKIGVTSRNSQLLACDKVPQTYL
jgi:hypothetical protein